MKQRFFILFLAFLLSGCASVELPTSPPSETVTIIVPEALSPLQKAISICDQAIPGSNYVTLTQPPDPVDADSLFISLGESNAVFQTQIASEELIIITHPEVDLSDISLSQVQSIFSGNIKDWSEISDHKGEINIWVTPDDEVSRTLFEDEVMQGVPINSDAKVAPTPRELIDAVSQYENGISYLPAALLPPDLSGFSLAIQFPVLVTASQEPSSPGAYNAILCLQGSSLQNILGQLNYIPLNSE
ncbi:MAG: substrate-binding domain-containing protein [Anaerolineales bacterium]|nr:substrate-binding domain-containing protein [Anaerolineales bacterium]